MSSRVRTEWSRRKSRCQRHPVRTVNAAAIAADVASVRRSAANDITTPAKAAGEVNPRTSARSDHDAERFTHRLASVSRVASAAASTSTRACATDSWNLRRRSWDHCAYGCDGSASSTLRAEAARSRPTSA